MRSPKRRAVLEGQMGDYAFVKWRVDQSFPNCTNNGVYGYLIL